MWKQDFTSFFTVLMIQVGHQCIMGVTMSCAEIHDYKLEFAKPDIHNAEASSVIYSMFYIMPSTLWVVS